jgi:signal transduction histidine kinase
LALPRFGIAGRLVAWATVFGTAAVLLLGAYISGASRNALLDREREDLATALDGAAARIDLLLEPMRQDARFLAHIPPLVRIVQADRLAAEEDKERLAATFSALIRSRPEYTRMRFIGVADGGMEMVRVERVDGEPARVPADRLQPRGDRLYFRESTKLAEGALYVSGIELDRESAVHPTLRIATPVYGASGSAYGIVVIDAADDRLFAFARQHSGADSLLFITNDTGAYLVHPDPAKVLRADSDHTPRIQDDFRELAGLFVAGGQPAFSGFLRSTAGEELAVARRVYLNPADPRRYVVLAEIASRAGLVAGIAAQRRSILLVASGLIFGGALVAILLANLITKPLRRVTEAANSLASGNHVVELAGLGARGDETGDLARAFDIMARQIAKREEMLAERAAELERSNADLAQFAYVASHDLQEPLRMVAGYVTLLRQRYHGRLDAEADEFIDFAADGAARMRQLINDLLNYSRASNQPMNVAAVDTNAVVAAVLHTLSTATAESGATIVYPPLPPVHGDAIQLERLFTRLLENAIKYRSDAPPRISIAAVRQGRSWLFSVTDNGIGVDPRFRERVFEVFKRLHDRTKYDGTGIGLAVCRMVVERHGGKIWIEDAPGGGAIFKFTLPAVAEMAQAA